MYNRFVYSDDDNSINDCRLGDVYINTNLKDLCTLLNKLQGNNLIYLNELERIKEGLISLDILLGDLSWKIHIDDEHIDINEIRRISLELSKCITDIMYPVTEDNSKEVF